MRIALITESTSDWNGWSYRVIMNILNAAVPPTCTGDYLKENVMVPATAVVISMETWLPTILNGLEVNVI